MTAGVTGIAARTFALAAALIGSSCNDQQQARMDGPLPTQSKVLEEHAANAGLSESLRILEEGGVPIPLQAFDMLDETSEELMHTTGFSKHKVHLLNASNRFGQWASVLNADNPNASFHLRLASVFKRAEEAVERSNQDNTPANVGRDVEFVRTHFEKIAQLHRERAQRHMEIAIELQ